MKFTSYFVSLNHDSTNFTGKITLNDDIIEATFIKIEKNIFVIHFKNQYEFKYFQTVRLNSSSEEITFLCPYISKYNKRKLGRLSSLLKDYKEEDNVKAMFNLLSVENFLKCENLLSFFKINGSALTDILTEKEIKNEIKIIDVNTLYITTYNNYKSYLETLNQLLLAKYNRREKSFKLSEVKNKLKLPKESIFFKYILNSLKKNFAFTVSNDRITFFKLSLSEKDLQNIKIVENELKKKNGVFSLDELIKKTGLSYLNINNAVWNLIEDKKVVQLNKKFFILNSELIKITNKLKKYKRNQGDLISIRLFRELTNYTRKSIIVILEYMDNEQITVRVEDKRKILLQV